MTRYRVTDTSSEIAIFIDAEPPFDLATFRPPGTYVLAALSEDSAPVVILPNQLPTTIVQIDVTAGIEAISFQLDTINAPAPPDPVSWTYAQAGGAAPGGGASGLSGGVFSLFPGSGAVSGDYTVRRTFTGGAFEDIIIRLTTVQPTITVSDDIPTLVLGADDPDATTYQLTVTTEPPGGPWHGVPLVFDRGPLDAAIAAGGAAFLGAGLIGFQTDTDGDGQVDQGDVVRILRGPITVPASIPITSQWEIDGVATGNSDPTFTRGAGVTGTQLRRRWTDGITTVVSNAIPLAQPVLVAPQFIAAGGVQGGAVAALHTYTQDLALGQAGDRLLVLTSNNLNSMPNRLRVAGVDVGAPLFTDTVGNNQRHDVRAWLYTLPSSGAAATEFILDQYAGGNTDLVMLAWAIVRGGAFQGYTKVINPVSGSTWAVAHTPPEPNSLLLAARVGISSLGGSPLPVWTGAVAAGRFAADQLFWGRADSPPEDTPLNVSVQTAIATGGHMIAVNFSPA